MYIDNEGNIYKELKAGIELTEVNMDFPAELEGYVGEIWFDERNHCMIDDREKSFWYKVENDELVKYDWKKRFEMNEFTLDDFKAKVMNKIKSDYIRAVQTTDASYLLYNKRKALDILELGDEEKYQSDLQFYKTKTYEYRVVRDNLKDVNEIDELITMFERN